MIPVSDRKMHSPMTTISTSGANFSLIHCVSNEMVWKILDFLSYHSTKRLSFVDRELNYVCVKTVKDKAVLKITSYVHLLKNYLPSGPCQEVFSVIDAIGDCQSVVSVKKAVLTQRSLVIDVLMTLNDESLLVNDQEFCSVYQARYRFQVPREFKHIFKLARMRKLVYAINQELDTQAREPLLEALFNIVCAEGNVNIALEGAYAMPTVDDDENYYQVRALRYIARSLINADNLDQAIGVVNTMPDVMPDDDNNDDGHDSFALWKGDLLFDITEDLIAQGHLNRAFAVANGIVNGICRAEALALLPGFSS